MGTWGKYVTTEYEAEAIAKRRHGVVTISDKHGVSFSIPVTILSYDWARRDPGKAVVAFECDGPPTSCWASIDGGAVSIDVDALWDAFGAAAIAVAAEQLDRDILGDAKEA